MVNRYTKQQFTKGYKVISRSKPTKNKKYWKNRNVKEIMLVKGKKGGELRMATVTKDNKYDTHASYSKQGTTSKRSISWYMRHTNK